MCTPPLSIFLHLQCQSIFHPITHLCTDWSMSMAMAPESSGAYPITFDQQISFGKDLVLVKIKVLFSMKNNRDKLLSDALIPKWPDHGKKRSTSSGTTEMISILLLNIRAMILIFFLSQNNPQAKPLQSLVHVGRCRGDYPNFHQGQVVGIWQSKFPWVHPLRPSTRAFHLQPWFSSLNKGYNFFERGRQMQKLSCGYPNSEASQVPLFSFERESPLRTPTLQWWTEAFKRLLSQIIDFFSHPHW